MKAAAVVNSALSTVLFDEEVKYLQGELLQIRGWRVFERAFPVLDVGFERVGRQGLRARLRCDNWNDLPPAVTLHDISGALLTTLPTGPTGVFNSSRHDVTQIPFICMAGSREYHTHPSHIADSWDNYKNRPGYQLCGILEQIWSAWTKSTP
jgi:hypothetical protein